jgi:glycerol-3-phosphate acyltransferase PlsY
MRSAQAAGAMAAIAGHNWSVFLKFHGGRGVATFLGGLAAMSWLVTLVTGAVILAVGLRTKFMSLGSIIGAVFAFILLAILNFTGISIWSLYPATEYVLYAMICAIFIFIMHRDNVNRLVKGRELRVDERITAEKIPSPGHYK